ncbi:MAG: thioredoxin family protein [Actinobacteria bacterium]|nr:thioredoxin family protein [Actinomycetota bacterium]
MIRFVIVGVVVVVALLANLWQRKRQVDAPTQGASEVPSQIDRADFARPDAPWIVLAFTSATCQTCSDIERKVRVLETNNVAIQILEYTAQRELHERYKIDAVPTVLMADANGVVQANFLGPVSATDLWAALARARDSVV